MSQCRTSCLDHVIVLELPNMGIDVQSCVRSACVATRKEILQYYTTDKLAFSRRQNTGYRSRSTVLALRDRILVLARRATINSEKQNPYI